jgi:NAD(P)-dependent dehydrogenase (short-subunit alcohol dehydrogenase family)
MRCAPLGAKVVAERCDVADKAAVSGFVKAVQNELGSVHVVLNSAVYRGEGPFLEEDDETWERNFAVNLTGRATPAARCCH